MPVITLYPDAVYANGSFTSTGDVTGNTTAYATHTGALAVNASIYAVYKFPLYPNIPFGAFINSIKATVIAKANVASRRTLYSIDMYLPGPSAIIKTSNAPLLTTDTTAFVTFTGAELTAAGWNTADRFKNNNVEWTATFLSTNATSTVTSWQKFILEIDYSLPGNNVLFTGELF